MFCHNCGTQNSGEARFCFNCGMALMADIPQHEAAASVAAGGALHAQQGAALLPPLPGGDTLAAPRYAGFWRRCGARVIDNFVIGGCSAGVGLLGGGVAAAGRGTFLVGFLAGYYLTTLSMLWLYFALTESSPHQGTLGKRALGVVVTDTSGRPITFARATGRSFAKFLNTLTAGVGWLLVAFTTQKRGLHDYIADTLVVIRPDAPRLGRAMTIIVVGLLAIPTIGIIAAVAVPGLLQARLSGNEASAIGTVRALRDAQETYRLTCDGYAPNVGELIRLSGGEFGDVADQEVRTNGYRFTIRPDAGAVAVQNPPATCARPVTDYILQGSPIEPGTTGVRYFLTDRRGVIFQASDRTLSTLSPLQ